MFYSHQNFLILLYSCLKIYRECLSNKLRESDKRTEKKNEYVYESTSTDKRFVVIL